MRILATRRPWQKGVIYALLFTFIVGLVYMLVLVGIDIFFQMNGIQHSCFTFGALKSCTFSEAVGSRFGFLLAFVLVFGLPLAIVAGVVGFGLEKIGLK